MLIETYLYARISSEENAHQYSISHQIEIMTNYAKKNHFLVQDIFIDNGYSGTNFNRPQFKKMMEELKQGKVKTFITKDLSRLGRNYLEIGGFLEHLFPENKIRYIAVNDELDTINEVSYMIYLKNLMNEFYIKDLSKKIRQQKQRKAQVTTITNKLPYGYQYDDKKQIILDPIASKAVKYIFEERLKQFPYSVIAKYLTQNEFYIPCYNKYLTTGNRSGSANKKDLEANKYNWNKSAVRTIINNIQYTGKAENYKTIRINGKNKSVPKEERIYLDRIFPQIISLQTYNLIQSQIKKECFKPSIVPHIKKILVDKNSHSLWYTSVANKKVYMSKTNRRNWIKADEMHQIIFQEIDNLLKGFLNNEKSFIANFYHANSIEEVNTAHLESRKVDLINQISQHFENKISGELSNEDYTLNVSKLTKELQGLEQLLKKADSSVQQKRKDNDIKDFIELLKEAKEKQDFDLVYHLIDKIVVSFNTRANIHIEIQYKFDLKVK